jgi:hypothetical protein
MLGIPELISRRAPLSGWFDIGVPAAAFWDFTLYYDGAP